MKVLLAASSFYEILLIVLVIVLISNSLLVRRSIKDKLRDQNGSDKYRINEKEVKKGEYVEYEIIND